MLVQFQLIIRQFSYARKRGEDINERMLNRIK